MSSAEDKKIVLGPHCAQNAGAQRVGTGALGLSVPCRRTRRELQRFFSSAENRALLLVFVLVSHLHVDYYCTRINARTKRSSVRPWNVESVGLTERRERRAG
jgi:hypothetical protein